MFNSKVTFRYKRRGAECLLFVVAFIFILGGMLMAFNPGKFSQLTANKFEVVESALFGILLVILGFFMVFINKIENDLLKKEKLDSSKIEVSPIKYQREQIQQLRIC